MKSTKQDTDEQTNSEIQPTDRLESIQRIWRINKSLVITIPRKIKEQKELKAGIYVILDWRLLEKYKTRMRRKDIHDAIGNYLAGEDTIEEEIKREK